MARFWGGKCDWFPKVEFDGIKLKKRYVQDSEIPSLLCFMEPVAFGGLTLALLWGTLSGGLTVFSVTRGSPKYNSRPMPGWLPLTSSASRL